jgi:hypothetical protein
MKKIILIMMINLIIISCKSNFLESELEAYNPYKVGDTLIFKSSKNNIDSFLITNKEIFWTSWTPIERDGWYNPTNAVIKYKKINNYESWKRKVFLENGESEFLHIWKHSPGNIRIMLLFNGFLSENINNFGELQTIELNVGKLILTDYFEILPYCDECQRRRSDGIIKVYWSKKYGILKYVFKSGEVWERTNL